jgi:hypothetical protein
MYQRSIRQGPFWTVAPPVTGATGSALGFGSAVAAVLFGALVSSVIGWSDRAPVSLALLALAMIGVGVLTTVPGALAAAAQGWAVYSGFVVHGLGELRLDPADRSALLWLVLLAVAASLLGRVPRVRRVRSESRPPSVVYESHVVPVSLLGRHW